VFLKIYGSNFVKLKHPIMRTKYILITKLIALMIKSHETNPLNLINITLEIFYLA
jgi:hypothetical protein